jgi:hypothetical protein
MSWMQGRCELRERSAARGAGREDTRMSDLEKQELAERAARDMDLTFTPHPQRSGRMVVGVPSFYDPYAVLLLDADTRIHMCVARPDDLRRALEYLPKDWRFGEVERGRFADYLTARLAAFEQFTAQLDDVERKAFSYHPS